MWWSSYVSATVQSTASNFIRNSESAFTHTYRAYFKTTKCGELKLRFWCSNLVDSTWADGSESCANMMGGSWKIESAYIADGGRLPDGSVVEGTQIPITFDSSVAKLVMQGEEFWSDAARIVIPEEHYLAFSWTVTALSAGVSFPYNTENPLVSAYDAPGHAAGQISADGFQKSANCLFLPDFIGCEREAAKRIAFLGDSITQGVQTRPDAYEFWVARIAEGLDPEYAVWNLGKEQELVWRTVNQAIRSHAIAGVDRIFDIAEVLSQEAPRDNLLIPEYMSSEFDAHPNGEAGSAVASAFLAWY